MFGLAALNTGRRVTPCFESFTEQRHGLDALDGTTVSQRDLPRSRSALADSECLVWLVECLVSPKTHKGCVSVRAVHIERGSVRSIVVRELALNALKHTIIDSIIENLLSGCIDTVMTRIVPFVGVRRRERFACCFVTNSAPTSAALGKLLRLSRY